MLFRAEVLESSVTNRWKAKGISMAIKAIDPNGGRRCAFSGTTADARLRLTVVGQCLSYTFCDFLKRLALRCCGITEPRSVDQLAQSVVFPSGGKFGDFSNLPESDSR